jgi:hypothetical protein
MNKTETPQQILTMTSIPDKKEVGSVERVQYGGVQVVISAHAGTGREGVRVEIGVSHV